MIIFFNAAFFILQPHPTKSFHYGTLGFYYCDFGRKSIITTTFQNKWNAIWHINFTFFFFGYSEGKRKKYSRNQKENLTMKTKNPI